MGSMSWPAMDQETAFTKNAFLFLLPNPVLMGIKCPKKAELLQKERYIWVKVELSRLVFQKFSAARTRHLGMECPLSLGCTTVECGHLPNLKERTINKSPRNQMAPSITNKIHTKYLKIPPTK